MCYLKLSSRFVIEVYLVANRHLAVSKINPIFYLPDYRVADGDLKIDNHRLDKSCLVTLSNDVSRYDSLVNTGLFLDNSVVLRRFFWLL